MTRPAFVKPREKKNPNLTIDFTFDEFVLFKFISQHVDTYMPKNSPSFGVPESDGELFVLYLPPFHNGTTPLYDNK